MKSLNRVPSVPLITNDPYFSVWSPADQLYEADTEHWAGAKKPINGSVIIDEQKYQFMGKSDTNQALLQTGLDITPTRTIYTFEGGGIELEVAFTSPLLLFDLELVSRPCTYLDFKVKSIDDNVHDVKVIIQFDQRHCHDSDEKEKMYGATETSTNKQFAWMGKSKQSPLNHSGDHITIDWGFLYIASRTEGNSNSSYYSTKTLDKMNYIESVVQFGLVEKNEVSDFLVIAYDDIASIMYFGQPTKAYWAKDGKTIFDILDASISEHDQIIQKCKVFDRELQSLARDRGGEEYELICSLAYRQTIAAHKLILDENEEVVFLSKECDSNGCIGTVDVSYPSTPLYLLYNSELVKGMMRPIFQFARLPVWQYDFAPHDVGRYPYATGQVYGLDSKDDNGTKLGHSDVPRMFYQYNNPSANPYSLKYQMPVEECGNMLIMAASVTIVEDDVEFASENIDLLEKWVCYLLEYGQDPGEQLCTDDFAGHLNHNVNLSVKAIMGIAAYSIILEKLGRTQEAKVYMNQAKQMAKQWEKDALTDGRTKLTFDNENSWSLKYNIVWDQLFNTKLFSDETVKNEVAWYIEKTNQYGVPLDSRKDYTKSDWVLWCATLAENKEEFREFIKPVHKFLLESPDRVAFSDWYNTKTGHYEHFKNRTVQGGLFMPLLKDFFLNK